MAEFTEQERLAAIEKYKKVVEEISEIEKTNLRAQGQFITKKREQLIQLEKSFKLQEDIVEAVKIQSELQKAQQDRANLAAQQSQLQGAKLIANQQQIAKLDAVITRTTQVQAKFKADMIAAATKDIANAQKKAEVEAEILDIQRKIEANQITPQDAQKRLNMLQDMTEEMSSQEKRMQGIQNAAENTFGSFANLLGINTSYSERLNEVLGSMKDANFEDIVKRLGAGFTKVFNITNLIGSAIEAVAGQIMEVLSAQTDITKETGLSAEFVTSFLDARTAAQELTGDITVLNSEMMKAGAGFARTLPIFTTLAPPARNEIVALGAALGKIGIETQDLGPLITDLMAMTGQGAVASAEQLTELTDEFLKFGILPDEAIANMKQMSPVFAKLGRDGLKSFKSLAKQAKALNLEISDLVGMTEVFDTFESGIPAAMQLNAVLGRVTGSFGNYIDAQALVFERDPAKKFKLLEQQMKSSGVSLQDLANSGNEGRIALESISQIMGTSPDKLLKGLDKTADSTLKMADGQFNLRQAIKDSIGISELFKGIMEDLVASLGPETIKNFVLVLKDAISFIASFAKENKETTRGFVAFGAALSGVGTALKMFFSYKAAGGILKFFNTFSQGQGIMFSLGKVVGKLLKFFKGFGPVGFIISSVVLDIVENFDQLKAYFSDLWSDMGTDVGSAFMRLMFLLPDLIFGVGAAVIRQLINLVNMIPGVDIENIGTKSASTLAAEAGIIDLPSVKGKADGGLVGATGIYEVGERGREYVILPQGSGVLSNSESGQFDSKIKGYANGTGAMENAGFTLASALIRGTGVADFAARTKGTAGPEQKALAKEIGNQLKPILEEVFAKYAGGDVMLDGKKVGKKLSGRIQNDVFSTMSKRIVGSG